MVPGTCLFIFGAGSRRLGLIIFGTQVIKKKRPVRPVFPDYVSVSYDYVTIKCSETLIYSFQHLICDFTLNF